jgi:uncharacterized protein (TIGR02246 family)
MRYATLTLVLFMYSSSVFAESHNAQERAIREVVAHWDSAWNQHDMQAMATLLTEDADFVNVAGLHWKGRRQIESEHAQRHRTNLKNSISVTRDVHIQLLSTRYALVHVDWGISGDTDFDGTPRKPREGVFTWLMEKQNGSWLIRAAQNTNRMPSK